MSDRRARATAALGQVIDETRRLFHRLKATAEDLHRQGEQSGGRRGVLKSLYESGPQTVPQLARARPVSRQHIQSLVNPLAAEGWVELVENPAHRRSKLVQLTWRGRELVEAMEQREARVLGMIAAELDASSLEQMARDLAQLRQLLERPSFQEVVERSGDE